VTDGNDVVELRMLCYYKVHSIRYIEAPDNILRHSRNESESHEQQQKQLHQHYYKILVTIVELAKTSTAILMATIATLSFIISNDAAFSA